MTWWDSSLFRHIRVCLQRVSVRAGIPDSLRDEQLAEKVQSEECNDKCAGCHAHRSGCASVSNMVKRYIVAWHTELMIQVTEPECVWIGASLKRLGSVLQCIYASKKK